MSALVRPSPFLAPRGVGASTFDADLAIQCALLRDVLEDTRVRYDQVRELFGEAVARGVLALTKDKKLPKPEQMADCLQRIRQQPSRSGWSSWPIGSPISSPRRPIGQKPR